MRIAIAAAAVLLLLAPARLPAQSRGSIYLQPIGKAVHPAELEYVRLTLSNFYDLRVVVLPRIDMPSSARVPSRNRYQADLVLRQLGRRLPEDGCKIVGLTADDISIAKGNAPYWGIIGLASMEDRACVVSTFRCGRGANGMQARIRLAKVAVHEVGHAFGLHHCPTDRCLMSNAGGKIRTVDRETDMCAECRLQFDLCGSPIPATAHLPWLPLPTDRAELRP